jgi:kynurenine/2-aminoadipate aminotransferase
MLVERLFKHWGNEGFAEHIKFLRSFYKGKRDKVVKAAEKHLTGLCEWNVPSNEYYFA